MDCPIDVTFDTEMSGAKDIEESGHSKDGEDDTWIEITPAAEKIPNTIRVITKLPNTEQSSKVKVKTHKSTNRQNQSTTGKLGKPQWP